ncbi:hypothetical protein GCK72_024766 [Caenorhabditis remanei]|uniref:Uncharacterized protein n=1 Tax=Caenorhabditis remanei TaxID=31234 RepID=E3LCW9_CAERE|nr:hypothetical protein GCK72_024766 [Caenorhabditis remanei]EFO82732.1 hypothetical protein CRE_00539 [Caenorhabditis remanei]KAF1748299.1 hypothetical protein GCK72_024766 [Caenorhabditis remanei]
MLNTKLITQLVLLSTIFSVVVLLSIKFLEIQKDYPRKNFCIACPSLAEGSLLRRIEIEINFNLLLMCDFLSMMMIILLFIIERYYEHPTYLFAFHVCRFIFNATNLATSDILPKIMKPMLREFCGFGGECSDKTVLPHTTVGLLYLIYFAVLLTNFSITIILMYFYEPYYQTRHTPIILHVIDTPRRSRPVLKLDMPPVFDAPPRYSSFNRSPSPPKMLRAAIPVANQKKYHRLESSDSFFFRNSKNKIAPSTLPQFQPQIMAC